MKKINASEFKAKCLALFDEVARTGEGITIVKHGKPIAQVLPLEEEKSHYPQYKLKGTIEIVGDILSPVLPAEEWDAEKGVL